jgi:hypothetical protein
MRDVDSVSRPASSSSWRKVALLCGGSAIFLWQLRHPIVRFDSPVVNELLGLALGLGLPWLTLVAIFRIGQLWCRTIAIIAVLPLLVYSFLFLLGAAMSGFAYKNGHDLSFDRFGETHWKGSDVRFYRTDGGATTDFGVVIRQEKPLFPGVLLVRRIDDFYPCYSLDATATDYGFTINDERSNCSALPHRQREYRLKPFVYF